jgi:N-acyl-D-aspartate/D-glutamate deacylase
MTMLDLKIVGGLVVDGSGGPARRGDVGVKAGRIVAVGEVAEDARETVDASGRIVAPGFIDNHTHYDAQVFWDPKLSPSCFHGVTTVVGGFCGFSIAPITPEAASYIRPMLAKVEGMPLEVLERAVPWNWESFGDYLARLDGKIGLNAGFFAGHSAIRRIVMGERAVGEKCTPDDLEKMQALLGKSLAEGALGFSTTISPTHSDGDGKPVPSRWADHSEIVELARVVRDHEGTGLELLPNLDFGPGVRELMADASIAGNRPVNWNVLAVGVRSDAEARAMSQLAVSDYARERGGEVIALTFADAVGVYLNFRSGDSLDRLPGVWREMFRWPLEERIARFKDPSFRIRMKADYEREPADSINRITTDFRSYVVVAVEAEKNRPYQSRKLADIAAEEGRSVIDVMLDIAVEDDLKTIFFADLGGRDQATYELRGRIWADDRTLIGASDAGAHIDRVDAFAFSTTLLQKGVREHKVISLEQAVHQITQRPAQYFGLIDRGLIARGYHADMVVFDPETVARGPTSFRYDIPGGADFRLYAEAVGVDHVFVNGVQTVRHGQHTGALPGSVLRSGKDTRTVPMDVLRTKRTEAAA